MEKLVAIQHWLYGGMASGLGDVAGGDMHAIVAAMAAAVLFGAVHALMPGHGKTVLVSYHLGQPAKLREGIANGAILALTHVGLALLLVLKRQRTSRAGAARQPSLLVAPASLLANWAAEIARFAPGLSTLVAHPSATAAEALARFVTTTGPRGLGLAAAGFCFTALISTWVLYHYLLRNSSRETGYAPYTI